MSTSLVLTERSLSMVTAALDTTARNVASDEWEFSLVSFDDATMRFQQLYTGRPEGRHTIYMVHKGEEGENTVFPVYVVTIGETRPRLNWILKEVQQVRRPVSLASRPQIDEYLAAQT